MLNRRTFMISAALVTLPKQIPMDQSLGLRAYNLDRMQIPEKVLQPYSDVTLRAAFSEILDRQENFAIQSSGHCFEGLSQTSGTLLDLRYLNRIHVDPSRKLLTAGAGATIGDVNDATAPYGLYLPAGYCPSVALGGHVAGGGVGVLSRRYGLASDQMVSATILTAEGALLNVSAQENPDLFWALRGGGGGNFGIVANYTLKLHNTGQMVLLEYRPRADILSAAAFFEKWQAFASEADQNLSFLLHASPSRLGKIKIRARFVFPTEMDPRTDIDNLFASSGLSGSLHKETVGGYDQIAHSLHPNKTSPQRRSRFASEILNEIVPKSAWQDILGATAERRNTIGLFIERMGGAISEFAPDDTAFIHRSEADFFLTMGTKVELNVDNFARLKHFRETQEMIAKFATGRSYINYPDRARSDHTASFWGENAKHLTAIKHRYDKSNLFRNPLGFA